MSQKWEVMLSTAMEMLQNERRYVEGRPEYETALEAGVRFRKDLYGPADAWTMVGSVRSKKWSRAFKCLYVLLRWYPQGLAMLMNSKLTRVYEPAS